MGSSGESSGGSSGDNTVHYAPYWEAAHGAILNGGGGDSPGHSVIDAFNSAYGRSPYGDSVELNIRDAFFTESYVIQDFPSLWDMFGKFMAGLDIHLLWQQTFDNVSTSPEINNAVTAQATYLDDDIETNVLPRFHAGMRNINAVQSSAFASGRALIEDSRVKAINKFASEIRLRALDISADMWKAHLRWNEAVINSYSNMFKLYYALELDVDKHNLDMRVRDELFDLGLFEYVRAMLGVVSGAQGTVDPGSSGPGGVSGTASAVSGALGGAATGFASGGLPGGIIGGVLGLASSFL